MRVIGGVARFAEDRDEVEGDGAFAEPLLEFIDIEVLRLRLELVIAETELGRQTGTALSFATLASPKLIGSECRRAQPSNRRPRSSPEPDAR